MTPAEVDPDHEQIMAGARTLANAPMPPNIARLPRDRHGYPIPWFVAELDDGTRDFRVADATKRQYATDLHLCWVCGQALGAFVAFVVGPMCALNRISAEPPSHRDCAIFAARCCPFLAVPAMRRRENNTPAGVAEPPGMAIKRNPGVTLVWVTRGYKLTWTDRGTSGYLCRMGEPTGLHWYRQGRDATTDEIRASFESGLPALQAACQEDTDPARSLAALDEDYRRALRLLPA